MAEPRSDDRSQARREAATLLGVDVEHLSAADGLRVDMISALRLVIDSEQATVLAGGSADLGKLNVAVQSLIALLPGHALPEPASNRIDPREIMLRTYKQMRERGAQFGLGYDGLKLTGERLRAELASKDPRIAELEAQLTGSVPLPPNAVKLRNDNPSQVATKNQNAPKGAIRNPSAPASSPPAAASAPVLGDLVMVVDPSPDGTWRDFIEPDGSIRATPFGGGKYWGPV
jgi:hypothetical protein